jgi:four helix bundle protein
MSDERGLGGPKFSGIRERSFQYALKAVRFYQTVHHLKRVEAEVMGKQYLRAATSVGANVEEAQSGESRADFIHKMGIAQKEARESLYWLRLISASELLPENEILPLLKETDEIISILTTIIVNTKKRVQSS